MAKKYYWLKLKEDFFEEDTIQWLEEQENGKDYCLFYLKLCLKSLKTNGVLIRNVGQILVPYDIKKLADITNTKPDTVIVAMEIFKKIGLVQVLENGEIYMTQLENMVGSESEWAKKKRKQRLKSKHKDNVPKLSRQCPTEIEIEKEIEIENRDRNKDIDSNYVRFFSNNFHPITKYELDTLKSYEEDGLKPNLITLALKKAVSNNKRSLNYVKGILNNWLKDNIKTLEQAEAKEKEFIRKKENKNTSNNFNNYDQRNYNFEELERKLLGVKEE